MGSNPIPRKTFFLRTDMNNRPVLYRDSLEAANFWKLERRPNELTSSFRIAEKAVDAPKTPYGRQRPPRFMKPCPEVQHVETAIRNTELENLKAENERLKALNRQLMDFIVINKMLE